MEQQKLYSKINHEIGRTIDRYNMIQDGDRILVAISGGKDSLLLLRMLLDFQKKAPIHFDLWAVNVDQGQPGYDSAPLIDIFTRWNVPYHIEAEDTYSIVLEKTVIGKSYCRVCSRLRRGILYRLARENGFNIIALGHHRDDMIHTFLMNAMFVGKIGGMPASYTIRDQDLRVIRPLASVHESWIRQYVANEGWTLLPCNLCGSQKGMKRKEVDMLLTDLEKRFPTVRQSLFSALNQVALEELLDVDSQKRYGIESRFEEQKVPLL